jgi:putative FmdB family regulatory protein
MALYEYLCDKCGNRFEKRMPMSDVLQLIDCPKCKAKAKKTLGNFAVVGSANAGFGDGADSWDDGGGMGDGGMGGMGGDDFGGHGHSHGPGGHSH